MYHPLPDGFKAWASPLSVYASLIVGDTVKVFFRSYQNLYGEAYKINGQRMIALAEELPVEDFERVFYHEVSHHLLGHVKMDTDEETAWDKVHNLTLLSMLASDSDAARAFLPVVQKQEAEADEMAVQLQRAFEVEFGPLIGLFLPSLSSII